MTPSSPRTREVIRALLERTAKLESDLAEARTELEAMRRRDVSLDIVAALHAARVLVAASPAPSADPMPSLMPAARQVVHGHGLLMAVLADLAVRHPGFLSRKTLFEIGTTRERMPDQGSTEKLAIFTALFGMRFVTIDMDPENTRRAQEILPHLNPHSAAVTRRGEDFFAVHPGPFDVAYLDAFDFDHGRHSDERRSRYRENLQVDISDEACWRMHLECAKAMVGKMPSGAVVVLDDTWTDAAGHYCGKGKLAIPYFLEQGLTVIDRTRMAVALQKP